MNNLSLLDAQVLATMTTDGDSRFNLDPRLLRHFAVLRLREPSSAELRHVIFSILEANLGEKPISNDALDGVATASCRLIEQAKVVLKPWYVGAYLKLCVCFAIFACVNLFIRHYIWICKC